MQQYSIKLKSKVARMAISGSKKGTISNKFCISLDLIDEYVEEYRKYKVKELKGAIPNEKLCKMLAITQRELNVLMGIVTKQNGRTNWITQMCKMNKSIYQKV